jgi:hypothetical protein
MIWQIGYAAKVKFKGTIDRDGFLKNLKGSKKQVSM